jgi:hypothetical protein
MINEKRLRIPDQLAGEIHRAAIREGRTFDNATRRLIGLGLDAARTPAIPRQDAAPTAPRSVSEVVAAILELGRAGEKIASPIAAHYESATDPELRAFMHRLGVAVADFSRTIREVKAPSAR